MPSVERSEKVPFAPSRMFDLVMDVERYPEFLSWCGNGRVVGEEEDAVTAEVTLEYKGFSKTFATRNRYQTNKLIEMRLLRGPFKFLEGVWTFEELDNGGCWVHMSLEFEFVSRWLSVMVGPMFHHAVDTLVADFRDRAHQLYGE